MSTARNIENAMTKFQLSPEVPPLGKLRETFLEGFHMMIRENPSYWYQEDLYTLFVLGGFVVGNDTVNDFYQITSEMAKLLKTNNVNRYLIDKFPKSVEIAKTNQLTQDGHSTVIQLGLENISKLSICPSIIFLDNTTAYMSDKQVLQMAKGLTKILPDHGKVISVTYAFGPHYTKERVDKAGIHRWYRSGPEVINILRKGGLTKSKSWTAQSAMYEGPLDKAHIVLAGK